MAISLFKAGHVQAKKFKTKFKYEIRQIDFKKLKPLWINPFMMSRNYILVSTLPLIVEEIQTSMCHMVNLFQN